MLTRVDRVQVVTTDARATAAAFGRLLDGEIVRTDRVRCLGARRTVVRLGASEIELLEADGAGPVTDFLARTRGGLFAAGFAAPDLPRLRAHLAARDATLVEEHGQLFLSAEALRVPGLRAVVSADGAPLATGLLRHLYEVTLLTADVAGAMDAMATTFSLDAQNFVPIRSAEFGYEGMLTLFRPDQLDRVEVIRPHDAAKTMGRFFAKRGAALYMCYAEAEDLGAIRARLLEHAPTQWTGPGDAVVPDNLFIHPPALGGMMLGVSRTSFAWTWSGHPEWVRSTDA